VKRFFARSTGFIFGLVICALAFSSLEGKLLLVIGAGVIALGMAYIFDGIVE